MTVSESDIIRDEAERGSLERAISNLETAIAVSNPGTRRILELSLAGAKLRVCTLDKKIEEAKVERAAEVQAQAAAAAKLAAKETALSASERETYRGFLEKEYFTKKDFGRLEAFYTHSYDRLSGGGKDEMSKRFWKGVEHGEYKFGDAPPIMQQKEADRAKKRLGLNELDAKQLSDLSNEQQRTFASAFVSDNHAEAKRILTHNSISRGDNNPDTSKANWPSATEKPFSPVTEIDLSSINLKNVQLADANPGTSASIPDASGSRVNVR